MNKIKRGQSAAGFTIVETLIVLAIAGLILLIVFEAIPALQRSSRNNQRRQDVSTILEAVSHYELNDSGNFPSPCGNSSANACSVDVSGANDNFLQFNVSKLTYYGDGTSTDQQVILYNPNPATGGGCTVGPCSQPANTNTEIVKIYNYQKCDPNNLGAGTDQGAGYNDIAALYAIETGSGSMSQCQQL